VTESGIHDSVRQALLPFWNTYYFLALYANADGIEGKIRHGLAPSARPLHPRQDERARDRRRVADGSLRPSGACASAREFFEVLTNWYVRRSRDRFWSGDRDAIDTLHTVLEVTCRVLAPLLPMLSETIWRGLTGDRSVHLTNWPLVDTLPNDSALVSAIDRVREVCSSTLALRMANKLRVRLPLAKLRVAVADADRLAEFADLIRDEVNVKEVELTPDVAAHGRFEITVNARVRGSSTR
jgi:isoleucyl-tRNA synthetase